MFRIGSLTPGQVVTEQSEGGWGGTAARSVPLTLPSDASSEARRHRVVGEAVGSNTQAGARAVERWGR